MIVEGLNCKYETIGEEEGFPGVSNVKEMPLLVTTDIRLVDPSTDKGAEVGSLAPCSLVLAPCSLFLAPFSFFLSACS